MFELFPTENPIFHIAQSANAFWCNKKVIIWFVHPCADPESFARGGPTVTTFLLFSFYEGKRIKIALKAGHHRPASETPFKWRFAGGPMMAQHLMLAL